MYIINIIFSYYIIFLFHRYNNNNNNNNNNSAPPAGPGVAKIKSDWNTSVTPQIGKGISDR